MIMSDMIVRFAFCWCPGMWVRCNYSREHQSERKMGQFRVPENASAIEDLVLSLGTYGDAKALEYCSG